MTKKELAALLGISGAMVTKLAKRGMPTDGLERAQRWRKRHLEPTRVKGVRYDSNYKPSPQAQPARPVTRLAFDPEAALRHAAALAELAAVAIDNGTFDAIEPALRLALSEVPPSCRAKLPGLPGKVWDALCADVSALLPEGAPGSEGEAAPMDAGEAEYMGRFWYAVAAGEVRPNP